MIGIRIVGGLGNQMFQYAFGRSLAEKNHEALFLDIGWYFNIPKIDTPRTFDLSCYDIDAETFRSDQHSPFLFHKIGPFKKVFRKLSQKNILNFPGLVVERKSSFYFDFNNFNKKTYFDGYWQSPKYFKQIRNILLEEFSPKDLTSEDLELAEKIKNENAVSVHIRRGDYITNEFAKSRHLVCDREYYENALSFIKREDSSIKYYFFSDDPEWVKNEFSDLKIEVVEGNDKRPWIDIFLMNQCKHHIIANSSFSWWGAWLSQRDGKIIAPKKWFTNGDTMEDLIPNDWIRL